MNLLSEADIKVSASKRTLLVQSSNFPLEVLYLRDDDIPQSGSTARRLPPATPESSDISSNSIISMQKSM